MLEHLRRRVAGVLAAAQTATLSTSGPAGIEARVYPCEAAGLYLYLLVPGTSDQLLNLEHDTTAVVTTPEWQLRGVGRSLPLAAAPSGLLLPISPQAAGCVLVEIRPFRLQINRRNGWGFSETIDLDG